MKGPNFSVATGVVVLLVLFAVLAKTLSPLIPASAANQMANESSDYLRAASDQMIDWRRPIPAAFSEARRTQRLILMIIGTIASKDARDFDRQILADAEVQANLRQSFVCIRVDSVVQPEWMLTFLPLSRANSTLTPGLQGWVLDPQSRLVGYLDLRSVVQSGEPLEFLDLLTAIRDRYDDMLLGREGLPAAGTAQKNDLLQLKQAQPTEPPPPSEYVAALLRSGDYENGGFPRGDRQSLRPAPFRVLALAGKIPEFRALLDPLLRTGEVDWLDGGFFRGSGSLDWSQIEYDKVAANNAEMLCAIAMASLQGDSFLRNLATDFSNDLITEFQRGELFLSARVGDEDSKGRSNRASFQASEVRSLFASGSLSDAERSYARTVLGLETSANPRMTIQVRDPETLVGDGFGTFKKIRLRLLEMKSTAKRTYCSTTSLESTATCTARMLEVGRLLGNDTITSAVLETFTGLDRYRSRSNVRHLLEVESQPYLGDYLAYADACFQAYLCTGDRDSFKRGLQVLMQARARFSSSLPGVWTAIRSQDAASIPDIAVPEIVDNFQESLEAKAIRLLHAYGSTLGGREGESLLLACLKKRKAYGSFAAQLGVLGTGYYAASIVSLQHYAIVKGSNAVRLAGELQRAIPACLVVPDTEGVSTDLLGRTEGIYVSSPKGLEGPVSFEAAKRLLSG